jgi:2-polyprenyl-3-methyl-5-hydroxy-6-metoxy-1,4-benzoquinol methylase
MTPVDVYAPNEKGFHDVFGNAWEWMEDYFAPLPGFEIHPYYEDFSTPCFDGLHNVIQGGSFISTGDEASVHSRFHFRPHFYQHSSFRLVEQLTDKLITSDTDAPGPYVGNYPFRRSQEKLLANLQNYENQQNNLVKNSLNQMISKHFGQNIFVQGKSSTPLQPLKAIITDFVKNSSSSSTGKKAIEVGCGVGGITFDLLRDFSTVIGIDHQQEYVSFARQLLKGESLQYSLAGEGDHLETIPVTAPVTLADLKNKKIEFRCADPMCLPAELNNFEFVFINDVLDKVSSPNSVLGRLGGVRGLVKPDGLLMIASSFQWNEEKTPRSLWLNDSSSSSEEELTRRLAADGFELKMAKKVPILWLDSKVNIQGKLLTVMGFQRKI